MQGDQILDQCESDSQSAFGSISAALSLHEEIEDQRPSLLLKYLKKSLSGDITNGVPDLRALS